ncbi:pyridoxal kinase PdxY [Leucobacter denitrificans]|uniref:pyridoxal kinase n=1 Tax=Leucobacter denitrificans TaxID=683042 RepID=A0A7G9S5Y8_9MICO|nr:pyridoxal kinase PdxY [Leucobacter denitrificans]QNN63263.1 pyridoxal kinase PdxY [Leucobacter denitrificans]
MRVLSIQSSVSYGHVGNSAAVFPLQRIGIEVMPISTVCFSNHTGYGSWRGPHLSGDDIREIVTGIEERGGLADVDAVLSGYQGGDDIGDAILDAVTRVKQHSPNAVYSCDPVLGNAKSGCHVAPEVQSLIRDRVVPEADLVTPNQFELGFVTGTSPDTLESTLDSISRMREIGPRSVLVTSVERPERAHDNVMEMISVTGDEAWIVETPRLPIKANGSGDVTAALFTAHLLRSGDPKESLARTASSVFALLEQTLASGRRELQLIEAQTAYAHPSMQFEPKLLTSHI